MSDRNWAGPDGELGAYIAEESENTLRSYVEQPKLVVEHANHEADTARGGYARRQLFELVQNSADALSGKPDGGRIEIRLNEDYLYCADDGDPIDRDGVTALMFSHLSPKRGTSEIGRFGLGFKSVLGVTDAPEFFSRSVSFRFDRGRSCERIRQVVPNAERYPALRLPDPIDPQESLAEDEILRELTNWATNIVRLPLKPDAHDDLGSQMHDFPTEFLLFVEHVRKLELHDDRSDARILELQKINDNGNEKYLLADGDAISEWKLFRHTHPLSSDAKADKRALDDGDDVPIWWAAPIGRSRDPSEFWAFFPTKTKSLVAGILNAPWKTNEDRQNLLPGIYNDELIKAAAVMIEKSLPELQTADDPAKHLDALPRRHQAGDSEQSVLLRKELFFCLYGREVVPDQSGNLRAAKEISYPPKELTDDLRTGKESLDRWAAHPDCPAGWLHHRAVNRDRLATISRLFHPEGEPSSSSSDGAPRASIDRWLTALRRKQNPDKIIEASRAAIQTAALIPSEIRAGANLGKIVRTASDEWQEPDPDRIFLPEEFENGWLPVEPRDACVHPRLAEDGETLSALQELGIKPSSPEGLFRLIAKEVLDSSGESSESSLSEFWAKARKAGDKAGGIVREQNNWESGLRIRTRSEQWRPIHRVLLPGAVVPDDGSRDDRVTVDMDFHEPDVELLRNLGVTDVPREDCDLKSEPSFWNFQKECRAEFQKKSSKSPRNEYLKFQSTIGSGPLNILIPLSDEGKARYTDALLGLDATYEKWTMRHDTQDSYPPLSCESLTIHMLREHGQVQTPGGIIPLEDALAPRPKSPEALRALLTHPKADKIKEAFNLVEPTPEFFGEEEPIPLLDVWPGLEDHLPANRKTCQLIRCERILVGDKEPKCVFHDPDIYLVGTGDAELDKLRFVRDELTPNLRDGQLKNIFQHKTREEIEERRADVRKCSTDAERLLAAVGEQSLRTGLPSSLLDILESDNGPLTGVRLADAAIATHHSDALRQYRRALSELDPPQKWAGSARAVDFVRSLGFSTEWAGERNRKRDPFLEIEGPYSLPCLHDYQRKIVNKVRDMLRNGRVDGAERRGMLSLPTGSGKTRVAAQSIVEAIREDGFIGGILWVADRDELCEQAVEAWRQVWSSIGAEGARLRISRLWAGQPRPLPTSDLHVVVATIQTLNAKLSNQLDEYEFLTDFRLVVFDEAHRSLAPTFTSVMREIGFTPKQGGDEPFLIGLTATPYRGFNEDETAWLANRYGNNRLDAGAFPSDDPEEVIADLQDMRVLARADHATIKGGEFSLSPDELRQMGTTPWLPQSAEERIAKDADRTKRIIEAYEARIESDWPTLIFATSVEHLKTVAALLNARGVKARAVSGETETSTRRRVVKEFRDGEIKALVNYGVFREGFDAPKTRAIIVARPVYSPNLYFQMIGRGLRGVKNGGNERCLILNVRDNIRNFGRELAFSDLDWLWA